MKYIAVLAALVASASATKISPAGHTDLCLEVSGTPSNGAQAALQKCSNAAGQNWDIQQGSTAVRLTGTNFCLDAGSNPGNGIKAKVWQCYGSYGPQTWWLTGDGRIAVQGKGQCLDVTNGVFQAGNVPQTWECGTGNQNQAWTVGGSAPPTTTPPTGCPTTVTVTVTAQPTPKKRAVRYSQHEE